MDAEWQSNAVELITQIFKNKKFGNVLKNGGKVVATNSLDPSAQDPTNFHQLPDTTTEWTDRMLEERINQEWIILLILIKKLIM